jgi:hypothetical protein
VERQIPVRAGVSLRCRVFTALVFYSLFAEGLILRRLRMLVIGRLIRLVASNAHIGGWLVSWLEFGSRIEIPIPARLIDCRPFKKRSLVRDLLSHGSASFAGSVLCKLRDGLIRIFRDIVGISREA